jgi:hypothetical protein
MAASAGGSMRSRSSVVTRIVPGLWHIFRERLAVAMSAAVVESGLPVVALVTVLPVGIMGLYGSASTAVHAGSWRFT